MSVRDQVTTIAVAKRLSQNCGCKFDHGVFGRVGLTRFTVAISCVIKFRKKCRGYVN